MPSAVVSPLSPNATSQPNPQISTFRNALMMQTASRLRPIATFKRSASMTHRLLQRNTHPWFCFFYDRKYEHDFQLFFRRCKPNQDHYYMFGLVCVAIVFCLASFVRRNAYIFLNFCKSLSVFLFNVPLEYIKQDERYQKMDQTLDKDATIIFAITCAFYICALLCTLIAYHRRLLQNVKLYSVCGFHLEQSQILLFVYFQFIIFPMSYIVIGITRTRVHTALAIIGNLWQQKSQIASSDADVSMLRSVSISLDVSYQVLVYLSLVISDGLYLYLLLVLAIAAGLFRLQYLCFLILVTETIGIVLCSSVLYYYSIPDRWLLFAVYIGASALLLRGAWEADVVYRKEFLSNFDLVKENRRLSHQNIEMKEELSDKLKYQLHYEMGDILRILCQIKLKIPLSERREIDKIITALITSEDLFEVTLDASVAENEEEVQGWLSMMALKECPNNTQTASNKTNDGADRQLISRGSAGQPRLLRTALSRRMSLKTPIDQLYSNATEMIDQFFTHEREEERAAKSRSLYDDISSNFHVDVLELAEYCNVPLQAVLITCIEMNNLFSHLSLNLNKIKAFSAAVENHYFKRNPYHNALHASSVVADMNFYLRRVHFDLDHTTILVGLIVAAAHDISHPGVSNNFLITTRAKLAITYSDDSILERMHVAELYRILSHEKYDIFSHMEAPVKIEIRKLAIQMILATDLSRLFSHISKLKSKKFAVTEDSRGLEKGLIMETLLMLSDLGHTAKPFTYHELWANRITEEFYRQGEAEERNKLPISPLCDRKQGNLPKSQATFLSLLATPLFETTRDTFDIDEFDVLLRELQRNIDMWQSMIDPKVER